MTRRRSAGLLLHPTSLPSAGGIGDLGPDAHRFVDVLAEAGMTLWQVLPLGPTGYGDSPYQCFSAFAGNPMLIHLPGFTGDFPVQAVDFATVLPARRAALRTAMATWTPDAGYAAFVARESWWLEDYALFMALKDAHGGIAWTGWEAGAARREPAALLRWRGRLAADLEHYRREQYAFHRQFETLRAHARERGVRLMGDVPIYVAHDSADVWANPGQFRLEPEGRPSVVAGVPPDYFSATGQRWGNPIYDWDAMAADGFAWWTRRMRAALAQFDLVRLDHFRGFDAYWEVPGGDPTAERGRWAPGPGAALFEAMTAALGPLPIVAEDLGFITPEVGALRDRFGYPGMRILQFAFGDDGQARAFQPHDYVRGCVVYTGTHDNDTAIGWWQSEAGGDSHRTPEQVAREKAFALRYLAADGHEMHWTLIRTAMASVADTVLVPVQDVLGLGGEARMNLPGRPSGNWGFRFTWEQFTPALVRRLRELADLYER